MSKTYRADDVTNEPAEKGERSKPVTYSADDVSNEPAEKLSRSTKPVSAHADYVPSAGKSVSESEAKVVRSGSDKPKPRTQSRAERK